ncbi:hypothetical protein SS50377_27959 [Spironucleus salmonicida]|uniref:Uncharacterized protein n=1 Tax=Spironucleus salmonicida TaxID=348837 RepID=V6LE12_9EUKA|nr:hypothetical protein SS50377_27959 [Spironucleus salmonicida]|eukprot:EST42518.1 hypothetical protein SS50377_17828 [Spironucleus salmonicida]
MQDDTTTIKQLQLQLQSQQQQLRISHQQAEQLQRLQQAIIRMFLEFRDRAADELSNVPAETQDQLLTEQPLVILDKLRAQLRILLSFKDDFENQLKIKTTVHDSSQQSTKKDVQQRLIESQDKIFQLKQELSKAKSDINNFEQEKDQLLYNNNQQFQDLKQKLTFIEKSKAQLEDQLLERDQRIKKYNLLMKNQDLKLARISELEAKLQQKETEFQSRIAKVQTLDRNEIIRLQREIGNFKKIQSENTKLKSMLKDYETQISSFKNNIKMVKFDELNHENYALNTQIQALLTEVQTVNQNYKQSENSRIIMELELKNAKQQLQQIKSDNDKFSGLNNMNSSIMNKSQTLQNNQNQYQLSTPNMKGTKKQNNNILAQYELQTALDKLKERDREIEELAKRVRKLLALQHKSALSQKAFQEEKQSLEKQIQQLRDEIAQLRKMQNFEKISNQKIGNSDELLRDVQNLRAFAITASSVYNNANNKNSTLQNGKNQQGQQSYNNANIGKNQQNQQIYSGGMAALEDVEDPREFLRQRGSSAKLTPGRGGGYGSGQMLAGNTGGNGRGRSAVQFGLM